MIGKATVARPYVDEVTDVRIPDASRPLHTYVIGRTGVGKTNTLKNIVRHDLGGSGPVIVIDPHGDLYDYAIKHAAHRETLVALDFTRDEETSLKIAVPGREDEANVQETLKREIELNLNSIILRMGRPRLPIRSGLLENV